MFKSTLPALLIATLAVGAALIVGCDDESTPAPDAPNAASSALPADLLLATAPADAQEVAAMRSSTKDGDRVVVTGVVAGRLDPIAENRAILTLADSAVRTCDTIEGDSCPTPWDACCEPADELAKRTVTVQVVDATGAPLKTSLSTLAGVKPLARLTVTGAAKVTPDGMVLINATGIHAQPKG